MTRADSLVEAMASWHVHTDPRGSDGPCGAAITCGGRRVDPVDPGGADETAERAYFERVRTWDRAAERAYEMRDAADRVNGAPDVARRFAEKVLFWADEVDRRHGSPREEARFYLRNAITQMHKRAGGRLDAYEERPVRIR